MVSRNAGRFLSLIINDYQSVFQQLLKHYICDLTEALFCPLVKLSQTLFGQDG